MEDNKQLEERIKSIYNDCWKNYKDYLSDHDLLEYNKRSEQLVKKYKGDCLVRNLLLWFAPVIQEIHNKEKTNGRK